MKSLFRLSAFAALALTELAAGSASAMPIWAHGIAPEQHLFLLRVVFAVGVVALGTAIARSLDGARRWLGQHSR
ncbi:MAG: hypothetical protein P4M09_05675 [Devosia sp.]|nr:hypothetical protein [Devosia sp.]